MDCATEGGLMIRPLTPEAARAILARETGEAFLALMQISAPGGRSGGR